MSDVMRTAVENLLKKAADSDCAGHAQQYAQASLNGANAMRVLWDMQQTTQGNKEGLPAGGQG